RDALEVLRDCGDHGGAAFALRSIGQICLARAEYHEAEECFDEALALYRRIGAQSGQAQVHLWRGMMLLERQLYELAREAFDIARDMCARLGERPGEALTLRGLGLLYQRLGDRDRALAVLTDALHIVRQPRPTAIESVIRATIDAI